MLDLHESEFHDGESGYRFIYATNERIPHAMQREDGVAAYLYYDQVGDNQRRACPG